MFAGGVFRVQLVVGFKHFTAQGLRVYGVRAYILHSNIGFFRGAG